MILLGFCMIFTPITLLVSHFCILLGFYVLDVSAGSDKSDLKSSKSQVKVKFKVTFQVTNFSLCTLCDTEAPLIYYC